MEVQAISKFVRMSPSKARDLARRLTGMRVAEALRVTTVGERKAACKIGKTLKSAIANAENNNSLKPEALIVKIATAGTASTHKRFQPKARGSAGPILKRHCHVKIVLTDE